MGSERIEDTLQQYHITIRLAGIVIAAEVTYPSTEIFCREYLTDEESDFKVIITEEDICRERRKSAAEDLKEGILVRHFTEGYLETLALYRKIAERLPDYHTLLFHGSAIAVDGAAYLFTAKSGTGKSTHTRLWRERFGSRAVMVNDDKPLLKITDREVLVCGTPWDGKHHLSNKIAVPLKAICVLQRDSENHIVPADLRMVYPLMVQQTFRPAAPLQLSKTLELLNRMMIKTKIYMLGCNMDPDAVRVAYEGMKEE